MSAKSRIYVVGNTVNGFYIKDVMKKDERIYVQTTCPICGKEFWARSDNLKRSKSCGCLEKENRFKYENLKNKKFSRLTVLEKTDRRDNHGGSIIWKCKCDCGNICEVPAYLLKKGAVKSCGCIQKEWQSKHGREIGEKTKEVCIEGTNVRNLTSKIAKNNTSGVKGVSWNKTRKRWVAQIGFKGKNYTLGRYKNKEDAIIARKKAEENLFGSFLEWYENHKSNDN